MLSAVVVVVVGEGGSLADQGVSRGFGLVFVSGQMRLLFDLFELYPGSSAQDEGT